MPDSRLQADNLALVLCRANQFDAVVLACKGLISTISHAFLGASTHAV